MDKTVILDAETRSGIPIEVTITGHESKCKSCGATIRWSKTRNDKRMPIEIKDIGTDTLYQPHRDNCPKAKKFRK